MLISGEYHPTHFIRLHLHHDDDLYTIYIISPTLLNLVKKHQSSYSTLGSCKIWIHYSYRLLLVIVINIYTLDIYSQSIIRSALTYKYRHMNHIYLFIWNGEIEDVTNSFSQFQCITWMRFFNIHDNIKYILVIKHSCKTSHKHTHFYYSMCDLLTIW